VGKYKFIFWEGDLELVFIMVQKTILNAIHLITRKGMFSLILSIIYNSKSSPAIKAVTDFDDSKRFVCKFTDCLPQHVKVVKLLKIIFRIMDPSDFINYFLKPRPT